MHAVDKNLYQMSGYDFLNVKTDWNDQYPICKNQVRIPSTTPKQMDSKREERSKDTSCICHAYFVPHLRTTHAHTSLESKQAHLRLLLRPSPHFIIIMHGQRRIRHLSLSFSLSCLKIRREWKEKREERSWFKRVHFHPEVNYGECRDARDKNHETRSEGAYNFSEIFSSSLVQLQFGKSQFFLCIKLVE